VYEWVVLRHVSLSAGGSRWAVQLRMSNTYYMGSGISSGDVWYWYETREDGSGYVTYGTADTNKHMLDRAILSATADQAHVDTTAIAGTRTGVLQGGGAAFAEVQYGCRSSGGFANVEIVAHVIAHNTGDITALPSAGQIASMRSFLTSAYWRGYTSDSLGLP
jgi:hypothetical protein